MSTVRIGISGWVYKNWDGVFYPSWVKKSKKLEFASRVFSTIEINGTFYSLQNKKNYEKWYRQTPDDFIFSVKANRYITHIKKLKNVKTSIANFFSSGPLALKEKLGPILWQCPPGLIFEAKKIEDFLKILPKNFKDAIKLCSKADIPKKEQYLKYVKNFKIKHALEVRNITFVNSDFINLLRKYNVALVFSDNTGLWPYFEDVTSDFIYIRLHGHSKMYTSRYDQKSLNLWSKKIDSWRKGHQPKNKNTITKDKIALKERDVFVYFDNDKKIFAPSNAMELMERIKL